MPILEFQLLDEARPALPGTVWDVSSAVVCLICIGAASSTRDVSTDNVWPDKHRAARPGDFDSAIPVTGTVDLRPITTGSFASRKTWQTLAGPKRKITDCGL